MSTVGPAAQAPAEIQAQQDTRDPRLLGAARMYEQQFLREMVKAMRQTVNESDFMPANMGEKIFRDQLDDKYVEEWSQTGGIGFADLIYNHVIDRYQNQFKSIHRPKSPLPSQGNPSFNFKVQDQGNKTKIHIQRPQTGASLSHPQSVVSPWDAKVTLTEGSSLKAYILDHGEGLTSTIAFDGTPVVQSGQTVKAGTKLGLLNPSSRDIFWNIERAG